MGARDIVESYVVLLLVFLHSIRYIGRGQPLPADLPNFLISGNESFVDYVRRIECIFCKSESLCRHYDREINFMSGSQYDCYQCAGCKMDKDCALYGDCCPGMQILSPKHMCVPLVLKPNPTATRGERVIAKCPSTHPNNDIKNSCENRDKQSKNISVSTPVTSGNGLTLRNRFCALCNGIENYTLWNITVECEREFLLSSTLTYVEMMRVIWKHDNCTIELIPPEHFLPSSRRCEIYDDDALISVCNVTEKWEEYDATIEKACKGYSRPFHSDNRKFNNVFCFLCNGDVHGSLETCQMHVHVQMSYQPSPSRRLEIKTNGDALLVPFSSIFNFNLDETKTEKKYTSRECGRGLVYDAINDTCKEIFCIPGWWLSGDECVKIIGTKHWLEYYAHVVYKIVRPVDENGCERRTLLGSLTEDFSNELSTVYKSETVSAKSVQLDELLGYKYSRCSKCEGMNFATECYTQKYSAIKILQGYIARVGYITSNEVDVSDVRYKLSELFTTSYNFSSNDEIIVIRPDENASYVFEQTHRVYMEHVYQTERWNFQPLIYLGIPGPNLHFKPVRFSSRLFCPHVVLEEGEFSLTDNSTVLRIHDTNISLRHGIFWSENGNTGSICTEEWTNLFEETVIKRKIDLAHGIVSLVCTCISILFLTITFIIYCLVRSMRTLPGLNNMALVFTLIIAQTLYQFGVGQTHVSRYACEVIGIATHYFWLAALFWMNVCCIYMFRIFGSKKHSVGNRSNSWKKTYFRHIAYTSSMPFSIIAVNVAVSFYNSSGESLGYAGLLCFITNKLKLGLTLALPVGCIILINIILFIKVVMSINKQTRLSASIATDRDYIHVYVRLSTITGVTWVFGFLHQMTAINAFGYLFTISNASQGVFIFVAFICSRTTFRHFRDLKRRRKSKSISSRTTGSTHV